MAGGINASSQTLEIQPKKLEKEEWNKFKAKKGGIIKIRAEISEIGNIKEIETINNTKIGFFKRSIITFIWLWPAWLIIKTQTTNIKNGTGNITSDPTGIKGIKEHYEQLHGYKFDKLKRKMIWDKQLKGVHFNIYIYR